MARYIDAEALKERLYAISVVSDDWYGMGINRGLDRAETAIDMMPTADVAPKSEVAREIFEEIEEIKKEYTSGDIDGNELYIMLYLLKKKYTEEHNERK